MTFTRGHDEGVARFEIVAVSAVRLHADSALDDKEPLRPRVPVPVRSSTVGECHPVHADWNAGLVVSQALDRRPAEEGCRIDRTDRRVTRSKDAHRTNGTQNIAIGLTGEPVPRGIGSGAIINMNSHRLRLAAA